MRICIVLSSYEGSSSPLQKYDTVFPNPNYYVDAKYHQFTQRLVRKASEKEDIDAICTENFDMYMNFMWGQVNDDVPGVEATRYLESKGVPIVCSPSTFMSKTKLDFLEASKKGGFNVPGNISNKFPKIVKYVDGLASQGMDNGSVCYSEDEVRARVALMQRTEPRREVLVQDFIRGRESTVMVMEMGRGVVALAPVDWVFDPKTPVDKAWLTTENKFVALGRGEIRFQFVYDEPRRTNLMEASIAAFIGLGMQGRGALGRVDMRCEQETNKIYCLELNHMPAIFYPPGDSTSDDVIIEKDFPGGHQAFFEVLLSTKACQMAQGKTLTDGYSNEDTNTYSDKPDAEKPRGMDEPIGSFRSKGTTIAQVYDSSAPRYDAVQQTMKSYAWQKKYFAQHDHTGTVLDLACGTGIVGMIIHQSSPKAIISGIDVSAVSLQMKQVADHYTSPSKVGYLQHEIMDIEIKSFDHVVCLGAFSFLSRTEFITTLARMFMVARKSITFDVYDVTEDYISAIGKCFGKGLQQYNNVENLREFRTPNEWKKVIDLEMPLFVSPAVSHEVSGHCVRFEKV